MRDWRHLPAWLAVAACALCWGTAPAQSTLREVWTTENGLPQNSVHALLQSKDGYLWLATENGVARFNGSRFERFGTETDPAFGSNDICCLAQSQDGAIWIGTSDGLVRFVNHQFVRVPGIAGVIGLVPDGPASVAVLASGGLMRVSGLHTVALTLPAGLEVTAIGKGQSSTVLVAAGAQIFRETDGPLRKEATLVGPPLVLAEDTQGNLWSSDASHVAVRTPAGEHSWQLGKDLPAARLESFLVTSDGVLAGTNRGAFLLPGKEPFAAQAVSEMNDTAVLSSIVDTEGDRWFGTDSSGIVMLRRRAVGSVAGLQSEAITAVISTNDGTHLVGTRDSGLRVLRNGIVSKPPANAKLSSQVILALAPGPSDKRGDTYWVGTPEGLDYVQGSSVTHLSAVDGLPDDLVRSLFADTDGSVWVGTRRGLAHLQKGRITAVLTRSDGLPSDVIGTMLRSRNGDLWIGTLEGLARLHGTAIQSLPMPGVPGSRAVTALAELPDGSLAIATRDSGLLLFRNEHIVPVALRQVSSTIHALLLDAKGRLWIRHPLGVAAVDAEAVERCAGLPACSAPVRQFGTADGMPSVDASADGHPAAWRDSAGLLWFATRRGLAVVDPAHLATNTVPPPIVIEDFTADNFSLPLAGVPRLGAQYRRIVIDFAGLSLTAPSQVLYRFKLEGFDRDWIEAGNRRSAEYTNLPPGLYRFLVTARNADGVSSPQPAELSFRVDAPFYRRAWFYLALLAVAALVTYGLYRLRLRRVRRDFSMVLQERNRVAREIHDTLAQDFVAVSLQLEVTSQLLKANATEAAREQVDVTRGLVREGIREARESIWALRAGAAEGSLPARLSSLVQRSDSTPIRTQCTITGAYRALPPHTEQELLRIAKEALGNAVRHASASRIQVALHYSEDAVELTVRDDGRGFSIAEGNARVGHYGLQGMRERAAGAGGSLEVQSVPGQGSTVRFAVRGDKSMPR